MAVELKKRGHQVSFMTIKGGKFTDKFRELGQMTTDFHPKYNYDLILCNHVSCQRRINDVGPHCPVIRTCHGPSVEEEQPIVGADAYVSVSEEVETSLLLKKYVSKVIRNGIDPERFTQIDAREEPKKVLFMSDYYESVPVVTQACSNLGLELEIIGSDQPVWDVERYMADCDIVISLGRGAYEGLMMNKAVFIFDCSKGDGWLDSTTWETFVKRNCSGRTNRKNYTAEELTELLKQYKKPLNNRELALTHHNIKKACDEYLTLADQMGAR